MEMSFLVESQEQKPNKIKTVFFPERLMRWLSDPNLPCIEWIMMDNQACVFVKDKQTFAARCYNGSYENFRRQLSEYKFNRLCIFRGRTENHNRAIFQRDDFFPGADISDLRKKIVKTKQHARRDSYVPELSLPPFQDFLQDTEFKDMISSF